MVRSTSEDVSEKSSRRAAESDFHVKLGPWPAFPPSPAETGLPPRPPLVNGTREKLGRERAKAKGVVMGRKPKLTHHQRQEAIARREAGESLVDIGRSDNVSHSTISRL